MIRIVWNRALQRLESMKENFENMWKHIRFHKHFLLKQVLNFIMKTGGLYIFRLCWISGGWRIKEYIHLYMNIYLTCWKTSDWTTRKTKIEMSIIMMKSLVNLLFTVSLNFLGNGSCFIHALFHSTIRFWLTEMLNTGCLIWEDKYLIGIETSFREKVWIL